MDIQLHTKEDFEGLRVAGRLAAECLAGVGELVYPGIKTQAIEDYVWDYCVKNKCAPATMHYRGFPAACCVAVNNEVCHGIPGNRVLMEGDIIGVDVTLAKDGWHGDTCCTWGVGKVNAKAMRLMRVTREAMNKGITAVRVGGHLGDIGYAIQTHAEQHGYSVVTLFGGHGIGRGFHLPPCIEHTGESGTGLELREGMVFTIEPMINAGGAGVVVDGMDKWTARTRDGSLSAQFEHTIGVGADGVVVFTRK